MARTYEHATIASLQREHVARTTEIDRLRRWVGYGTRRNATLYGRDAGGGRDMVNADGEGRLMVVAIVHHHLGEVKTLAELTAHRHTDESLGKRCHKIDILCSGELRRTDKIALVLTIGVVNDKYALACTESLKGFVYRIIISHNYRNAECRISLLVHNADLLSILFTFFQYLIYPDLQLMRNER